MVTHTINNLDLCDKVIIMGYGGRLCYCGSPAGIKDFFHTDNLVKVYDIITELIQRAGRRSLRMSGINAVSGQVRESNGEAIKTENGEWICTVRHSGTKIYDPDHE